MPVRTYRGLLVALALVGFALDLGTKYGIFAWLEQLPGHTFAVWQAAPESRTFAPVPVGEVAAYRHRGFFLSVSFLDQPGPDGRPVPHVNHGALFGLGQKHETLANAVFAVISLVAALAIVLWSLHRATAADRWLCVSLGLILGGTLGNFYDRVFFNGVRDFLHWHYLFDWPVFNVADCCLVAGAGLLLLQAFFVPQAASQPQPAAVETAAPARSDAITATASAPTRVGEPAA